MIQPTPDSTGDMVIFNEIYDEAGIVVEGVIRSETGNDDTSPYSWWRQYKGVYNYYASYNGWHEFR
jgi:hypothetical protein